MPEYYKYAGRDAADQVNWAEIGKNMSDMLANENKIREDKKAAIDEASRQFGLQLANAPQGQDASARSAALEYADNASKFMRMQDQLLKSGKMKFKDYTVARQSLLDGTDQAFDALTGYQKVFAEKWRGQEQISLQLMNYTLCKRQKDLVIGLSQVFISILLMDTGNLLRKRKSSSEFR